MIFTYRNSTPLLLITLTWLATWAIVGSRSDFPLNDDWVYANAVRSIVETGHFDLGSSDANLISHAFWGALFCVPFGFSFTAIRVSTYILGLVGPLATYLLLHELGGQRWQAIVGALALAFNPIYLQLSFTFMTDVSFAALVAASMYMYVRGVHRESGRWVICAYAIAIVAFMSRQFAFALPVAYAAAYVMRKGFELKPVMIALFTLPAFVALQIGFEHAVTRTSWDGVLLSLLSQAPADMSRHIARAILDIPYIGLFIAPFFLSIFSLSLIRRSAAVRRRAAIGGVVAFALTAMLSVKGKLLPNLGNVLMKSGVGPLTLRDTYVLKLERPSIPDYLDALWIAVAAFGMYVGILALGVAGHEAYKLASSLKDPQRRRLWWPQALMISFAITYWAGVILRPAPVLDRYLIPLILPFCALLLPYRSTRVDPGAAASALTVFIGFSFCATHDYLAWNQARWRAADSLMAAGASPREIDGGYEFNGWFLYDPSYRPRPDKSWWWVEDDKYMITSGPMEGYHVSTSFPFRRWLGLGAPRVFALIRDD
jgi:hypothetical protein